MPLRNRVAHTVKAAGFAAVLSAATIVSAGCGTGDQVQFRVWGDVPSAKIIYGTGSFDDPNGEYTLPWKATAARTDGSVYVVHATGQGNGTIHCSVTVDGQKSEDTQTQGWYYYCEAKQG